MTEETTKPQTLAEMIAEARALRRELDLAPSPEEVWTRLEALESSMSLKVDAYKHVVDSFEAEAEVCARNAKEWTELSKSLQAKADRVTSRLEWHLKNSPDVELRGERYQAVLTRNPPSLVLPTKVSFSSSNVIPTHFVESVPEYFRETVVVNVFRTDAIKEYIKQGGEPLAFATVERKERVSFKPLAKKE